MPLNNRVAVLIGATGQLGPAIARAFAQGGATLVLAGTAREALETLRRELPIRATPILVHPMETMDELEMEKLVNSVTARFGHVDILLHTVGSFQGGTLEETSRDVWDDLLEVNLFSAVNAIRAFLPVFTQNGWGRIVTISSGVTQAPLGNVVAYVTAKAALETMTLAVAQEVKDQGVTANVVLIRSLDTPSERAKQPNKKTGWVKPEEVAAMVLFLCLDEARAINGARIPMFGG